MMVTGTFVSILVMVGCLFLNYRALQADGLSLERKAAMAVSWIVIIAITAFLFDRFAQ